MQYTQEGLNAIIELHKEWLIDCTKGEKADLGWADLRWSNLRKSHIAKEIDVP